MASGLFARIEQLSVPAKVCGTVICFVFGLATSLSVLFQARRTAATRSRYVRGPVNEEGRYRPVPLLTIQAKQLSHNNFALDLAPLTNGALKVLEVNDTADVRLKSSHNNGDTWDLTNANGKLLQDALGCDGCNKISFSDQTYGWAFGSTSGLWRTNDGGASWTHKNLPKNVSYIDMAWVNNDVGYLAGTVRGNNQDEIAVLRTDDSGRSWQMVTKFAESGSVWQILAPAKNNLLLNLSSNKLLRSQDGGVHWSEILAGAGWIQSVVCDKKGNGWIVGDAGNFRRFSDYGATLKSQQELPVPAQKSNWRSLAISPEGFGVAVGADGAMVVTNDGGTVWQTARLNVTENDRIKEVSRFDRVIMQGGQAFIFAADQVFRIAQPKQIDN